MASYKSYGAPMLPKHAENKDGGFALEPAIAVRRRWRPASLWSRATVTSLSRNIYGRRTCSTKLPPLSDCRCSDALDGYVVAIGEVELHRVIGA
jgi:hypothetical protein